MKVNKTFLKTISWITMIWIGIGGLIVLREETDPLLKIALIILVLMTTIICSQHIFGETKK